MKAVELKNLRKSFGGLQAVKNLSMSIEKGERHAIIGPNGAGKTTLLNLIAGLFPCDGGEIRLFGRDITGLPDSRRIEFGLARTFQLTSIFLDLTVLDNILLASQAVKPYHFQIFRYQGSTRICARKLLIYWRSGIYGTREILSPVSYLTVIRGKFN